MGDAEMIEAGADFWPRLFSGAAGVARSFAGLRYLARDYSAIRRKDPALAGKATGWLEALLYPSLWALALHRLAHPLYRMRLPLLPRLVSMASRLLTGIEIHPGAAIGPGLFVDHGMGTVIGETAEIGSEVVLFHQVTLGGRGSGAGKRHPTIGDGVLIGAGAKILGAIRVGNGAKVGANAVVLEDVPEGATVVGIPARLAGRRDGECARAKG
jgi:serine O-acetyltransferase